MLLLAVLSGGLSILAGIIIQSVAVHPEVTIDP
jgi:hypothetical protein